MSIQDSAIAFSPNVRPEVVLAEIRVVLADKGLTSAQKRALVSAYAKAYPTVDLTEILNLFPVADAADPEPEKTATGRTLEEILNDWFKQDQAIKRDHGFYWDRPQEGRYVDPYRDWQFPGSPYTVWC